jgi:acyl-coenzyme A thioesterase PaaI-like protein
MRLLLNGDAAGSVTLDLATQFIGAGRIGQPLDLVCEVLRETGRLVFLRGLVVQEDETVASFTGTVRKPSRK